MRAGKEISSMPALDSCLYNNENYLQPTQGYLQLQPKGTFNCNPVPRVRPPLNPYSTTQLHVSRYTFCPCADSVLEAINPFWRIGNFMVSAIPVPQDIAQKHGKGASWLP